MRKIFFIMLVSVWIMPVMCISQTFVPDTTVNGVLKVDNFVSIEKHLGDIMDKTDHNADLPDIYFTNKSSTQYLRLIFFPGSTRNCFHRFEIGVKALNKKYTVLSSFSSFRTESKICIGSSLSSVITKKGKGYKKNISGSITVLSYEVSGLSRHPFLYRYNMPSYSAKYYFKKGRLFKMSYGFDYP